MNKVILSGNLARDPEVRYTQSGKAVATLVLAVSRGWRKQNDNQQPTADFFNIVAWEKTAEFCSKYLTKGSRILVEGRLQTRTYEAQDGSKRYITEVISDNIEFGSSKRQDSDSGYSNNNARNLDSSYDGGGDMNDHGVDKSGDEIDIPF